MTTTNKSNRKSSPAPREKGGGDGKAKDVTTKAQGGKARKEKTPAKAGTQTQRSKSITRK